MFSVLNTKGQISLFFQHNSSSDGQEHNTKIEGLQECVIKTPRRNLCKRLIAATDLFTINKVLVDIRFTVCVSYVELLLLACSRSFMVKF